MTTRSKIRSLLLIVAFLLITACYLEIDEVAFVYTPTDPVAVPATTIAPSGDPPIGLDVYFTSPVSPFDGVVQGGIETHLVELINSARISIDAAVFEIDLAVVAGALIDARDRGVIVRLVYDDDHADPATIRSLVDAGIPAVADGRSAFMHDKFFVIDHAVVWTGSFNITESAAYKNDENAIVITSGDLSANYTNEFNKMFAGEFGPRKPSDTPHPRILVGSVVIFNYFAPQDDVMDQVITAVTGAQTSIDFMTFSFTDDLLGQAMINRMRQGVIVSGIFESLGANTDSSECPRLLNAHADIRLDGNKYRLHDKVIIIDRAIVITGSFNFSENANESNDENLLIIYDPAIAGLYLDEFQRLYAESGAPEGGVCKN